MRADAERQMFKVYLRSLLQRGSKLFFIPKIMFRSGGIGLAVALIIFHRGGKMLAGRFANRRRFVQEDDRAQGAFGQFEQRRRPGVTPGSEQGSLKGCSIV